MMISSVLLSLAVGLIIWLTIPAQMGRCAGG